jgi:hypothetical protein
LEILKQHSKSTVIKVDDRELEIPAQVAQAIWTETTAQH